MPPRTAPRIDQVLVEVLRPQLPGVTVRNLRPNDLGPVLPFVAIKAVAPGDTTQTGAVHGLVRYQVDVQSWADTREGADDLDQAVWQALLAARRGRHIAAGGALVYLEGGPGAELRDINQDDRIHRWQASNTVGLRTVR